MESKVTLAQHVERYEDFDEATRDDRQAAELCRDYYDGEQWTDEEIAELNSRGQPVVTTNRIAPKINFLIGGEIETRVDPKALPRTPREEDGAQAITDSLRYVASREATNFDALRTTIAGELFIEGASASLLGVKVAKNGRVEITNTHVPYDRFYYDPRSRHALFDDAKYLGVVTWLDELDAKEKYPGKGFQIDAAMQAGSSSLPGEAHEDRPGDWADDKSRRLKVAEEFWREKGEWWTCHFVKGQYLRDPEKVKFVDEDGQTWCPLRGVSAFVSRKSNGRYGLTKGMLSPQDEINKRRSLALHLLMQNRVIYERSAVDNVKEFQTELAKPDGAAVVNDGALVNSKVKILDGSELAAGQAQLLGEAKAEIDAVGPSAPVIAGDQSVQSGIAILRKRQIGNVELRPLFANIEEWQHGIFLGYWWLIRQFWPTETWLRVGDDEKKTGYRFVGLNRKTTKAGRVQELLEQGMQMPDALASVGLEPGEPEAIMMTAEQQAQSAVAARVQSLNIAPDQMPPDMQEAVQRQMMAAAQTFVLRAPQLQTPFIANDVSQIGVDIMIESAPDLAIVQEEQFTMLSEMAAKGVFNPQITPIPVMRMLLNASQLRDKKRLLADLEELSKPQDPAAAQASQQQMALQMQSMQAQVQKLMAEIDKIKAETAKTMASIPAAQAEAELNSAKALMHATQAGRDSVPDQPQEQQKVPAMAAG